MIKRTLINSDCITAMREMPDNSVDSIVTDPPYELGFMGKSWDSSGIAFNAEVWREALRVLKPGGHLLAFSGSRTYHRMAVAIEDAGFEIRDQIMWVYGSGFPKSHNISKALDKIEGVAPTIVGERMAQGGARKIKGTNAAANKIPNSGSLEYDETIIYETTATSDIAKQWQGWGTALKPAHEPMVLARKPLIGTVANNVLTFGTGGLNIDGSRVGRADDDVSKGGFGNGGIGIGAVGEDNGEGKNAEWVESTQDRWPANFIHDGSGEVNELLGEPARFFYCAKASKRDRNEGLDGFEEIQLTGGGGLTAEMREDGTLETASAGGKYGSIKAKKANYHPTVKPTSLMQYLVRLVTPPNGTVLDPFMGSGSTGKACAYEGFNFIGIDQSAEYVEIARARIEYANQQIGEVEK